MICAIEIEPIEDLRAADCKFIEMFRTDAQHIFNDLQIVTRNL